MMHCAEELRVCTYLVGCSCLSIFDLLRVSSSVSLDLRSERLDLLVLSLHELAEQSMRF